MVQLMSNPPPPNEKRHFLPATFDPKKASSFLNFHNKALQLLV